MSTDSLEFQEEKAKPITGQAVSVNMLKGGVGKSLLALNLADRLSQHGHDVLFMDLDPNGHITESLGYHDVFEDPTHDLTNIVIHEYGEFDEYIFPTGWEWDFVPASVKLSTLESELSDNSITLLKKNFTQPLLNDGKYDYIIMDGGGEWSHIAKAAYGAAGRTIIPIPPGDMNRAGFKRTYKRVVDKMPEQMDFKILAIVPNMISEYLKHDKADRRLIESLNHSEQFSRYLPSFARIPSEDWDAIDAGEMDPPKPGLRKNSTLENALEEENMPFGRYLEKQDSVSQNDRKTLNHLDELVRIVEQEGVANE
ncbi:ParA family protein (plasmid) [Halococcus dombrowskii]|uniref:ParA family protein n=1 Tax=Halococcus dombrowskii TaxID=179637 RepID=A0AAV3SL47_HALDO|nr:ParA family protein [Halococcus dombrowskii]UOO96793.1 ParA family protein [Halococcus dombrowskii]